MSYDGKNLLYTSENLRTHVTSICLYNADGKETYMMYSNSGIVEIDPGFDFSRLLYCPLPGVGLPKMPFFTLGFPTKILGQVIQVTALNVSSEPRYVDNGLYQTPGKVRDYGLSVEADEDARYFRPESSGINSLGCVVTAPALGIPKVLWFETFAERKEPYLGQIWKFYGHTPFQGVWLAKKIKMRHDARSSNTAPHLLVAADYDLQSARSQSLAPSAYDPATYLLKHANITDYTGSAVRTFVYEPSKGALPLQRYGH